MCPSYGALESGSVWPGFCHRVARRLPQPGHSTDGCVSEASVDRPLIMVLNADQSFLDMICELLIDEGYDALTLRERDMAFEAILEHQPQLVIIELLFTNPEAGLMVVNKMRLHPKTVHIPVIIASTTTQLIKDNEAHLRSKGCDFLQKPFDLEELLTIVSKYVLPPEREQ